MRLSAQSSMAMTRLPTWMRSSTGTGSLPARRHGVKMMVVAPTSTIDWQIDTGEAIEIEERSPNELLMPYYQDGGEGIDAWNPVFDVTPAELIDAIVTEKGVVMNPEPQGLSVVK